MHQTTQSTTSKEKTISKEKTGTIKIVHDCNEGSFGETKITSEVPSENDHVLPKTSQNKLDTGKKEKTADNEIIGYVESVSPSKRNRRSTTDYSDIALQLHGGKRRRAVCFSEKKRLLLERKNNKTKLSKFNKAKNSETVTLMISHTYQSQDLKNIPFNLKTNLPYLLITG